MIAKPSERRIVFQRGNMRVNASGFVMVGGKPLGTLQKDCIIELHVQKRDRCDGCEVPTVDLMELCRLSKSYGVEQ